MPARPRPILHTLPGPWVIKTDGLAAGKGVLVTDSLAEAEADIDAKLSGHAFGEAGRRVVVEEGLTGPECSLLVLCDGRAAGPAGPGPGLQAAGRPTTGGPTPGGWGPTRRCPRWTQPWSTGWSTSRWHRWWPRCRARGIDYRGVLYAGLMLTADGPKVLEFNVRFGDPEAQVVLPRLEGDLTALLAEAAAGALTTVPRFLPDAAVCVVLASEGYPEAPRTGDVIARSGRGRVGGRGHRLPRRHGSPVPVDRDVVTAGGRVLGVTALRCHPRRRPAPAPIAASSRPSRGRGCRSGPTSP